MKRGDIVLLDYPYADGSGSKVRPALVVQKDRDNQRLTNTIVALITKNVSRVHEPTQLLIDVSTPEGRQSGLNQASAVTCGNLFTVAQTKVRRVIGSLSPSTMAQIDACLRASLDLP
ncbi:MAG: type II toxin-antitoxin system PemK/MazF family toxin [Isosphaeraceae bacterium]